MKQMNKAALILALCVSTQAFGWRINFDPNTYDYTFHIMTFEEEGDYRRMLTQLNLGKSARSTAQTVVGVVAPLAGKVGSQKVGGIKATDAAGKVVLDAAGKEVAKYSSAEMALIEGSISLASTLLVKLVKSETIAKAATKWTHEGYTIDNIESFRPSSVQDYKCRDAKSLTKHVIHSIKKNKNIFYVVFNAKNGQLFYANHGPAYGEFNFKLVIAESTDGTESVTVGDMQLVSPTGGESCSSK